jgi:hypothetical protein
VAPISHATSGISITGTGLERLFPLVPSPTCPELFEPQQRELVFSSSAQLCTPPAVTTESPLLSPLTSTGVVRLVVPPSPSWPKMFQPQHFAPPAVVSAHV